MHVCVVRSTDPTGESGGTEIFCYIRIDQRIGNRMFVMVLTRDILVNGINIMFIHA